MRSSTRNNFRILLLIAASALVIGLLVFSQRVTEQLLDKQREVVDLYAKSYEYIASDQSGSGDFTFVFDEVIRTIDFPIILTDPNNNPIYWDNIKVDTLKLTADEEAAFFKSTLAEMDEQNRPIRIALNDTIVLNYVHFGESELIRLLRWLPFIEIGLAAIFVFIAYIGFSYIKRSEQSNIWVGMAKETAHQLGTPLSSIMGWMELVKANAASNPKLVENIQEMANDIERLNKVTARFSKIGSTPNLKEENLSEVISGVISYISKRLPKSGKTVDIRIETPGEFRALINRELFEWVVENLMKNALDAMEGTNGRISFALSQMEHRTTIDITDTGKGIDPKLHKEIFRPGYSTKKARIGIGTKSLETYH